MTTTTRPTTTTKRLTTTTTPLPINNIAISNFNGNNGSEIRQLYDTNIEFKIRFNLSRNILNQFQNLNVIAYVIDGNEDEFQLGTILNLNNL